MPPLAPADRPEDVEGEAAGEIDGLLLLAVKEAFPVPLGATRAAFGLGGKFVASPEAQVAAAVIEGVYSAESKLEGDIVAIQQDAFAMSLRVWTPLPETLTSPYPGIGIFWKYSQIKPPGHVRAI